MNRRSFLSGASLTAAAFVVSRSIWGAQSCYQPVNTPYGPIQRCTAGIDSMNFQTAYQQQSEWCWVACLSMIFRYHGHPVSQIRIVRENWQGNVLNMPAQPDQILANLNSNWTDDNGNDFSVAGDSLSANNISAVMDLQQDEPLIIGALGHAMILTALTADTNLASGAWQIVGATVRDPLRGQRVLSPQEWYNIRFAARVRVSD